MADCDLVLVIIKGISDKLRASTYTGGIYVKNNNNNLVFIDQFFCYSFMFSFCIFICKIFFIV